ncbi:MAG: hypothetical protein HWD86_06735 [Kangiellaceae bacterium]|nr:hypothetical protein [Kangiellaceae bacterium]
MTLSLATTASTTDAVQLKPSLNYYFDQSIDYDDQIITPQDVLGHQVGEWHVRPDQSLAFFNALAKSSSKVEVKQIGRTHENRPLITAYISSPENIAKLDEIKASRSNLQDYQGPTLVWLGYSVHGNEASGANAALLVAYRLAASQEPWIQELLKNTVVMIDPMLNPDGLDRFANWVNRYKGQQLVADSDSAEHNEEWPQGRTNHYWFDLNRDWLLLQHPESQARVEHFYQWRPHIVGDFHEMGTNATYFFQPGVPSRQNPLTSQQNFDLTNEIAKYHAQALDKLGASYYSKESFDDFYYGKGSTFPDINGGIGILFEQASARGHLQESVHGDLSFPFAIRNQVATSFSTLKASLELKDNLQQYQKDFFYDWVWKSSQDPNKAAIFTAQDKGRLQELLRLLNAHQILVEQLQGDRRFVNKFYPAGSSYVVKFKQQQYGLIKALFEARTEFNDNTFYDVSAWTFPLAFNTQYQLLDKKQLQGLPLVPIDNQSDGQLMADEKAVAYVIEWNDFRAATALIRTLKQQFIAKVSNKSFSLPVNGELKTFSAGTLVITVGNKLERERLVELIKRDILPLGINVYGADTGFSQQGIDLGSPSLSLLSMPKPLLLIGDGVSSYEAGEVWHLLDTRVEIPVAMQSAADLADIDLSKYSHLLMVNGRYPALDEKQLERLKGWLNNGGNLVATRGAVRWLIDNKLVSFEVLEAEQSKSTHKQFAERDDAFAEHIIGGAIFQTQLDNSHPLTYGIELDTLALTKSGTTVLKPANQDFVTVASYTQNPLVAGYSSQTNINRIKNTPAILAQRSGRGTIIMFNDNPNFRGYWLGSMRLYINSLFFNGAL